MKDSKEVQRKQKTRSRGCPQEARVELGDNAGVLSISTASERGRDVENECTSRLLEKILDKGNFNLAFKRVKSNKGSHGVDGMKVDELLPYLKLNGETIKQQLLEGTYRPAPVRRVEIPKPDGGVRLLGIPTVLDRWLQQAIAQVLSPIFEEGFSANSYGFRPGRNAQQAVEAARKHIENGYKWTVDLDLEKFFDRVNHDKLMSQVAKKVQDKRVLKLIRLYLESGVIELINSHLLDCQLLDLIGFFKSPWAGLDNFKFLFNSDSLITIARNTILYNLVFTCSAVALFYNLNQNIKCSHLILKI